MRRRVSAIAITACLALFSGQALSVPWHIGTDPATEIASTSVVLNGDVYWTAGGPFDVRFGVGTSPGAYTIYFTADQSPVAGSTPITLTATATGLAPSQTYYFQAMIYSGGTWQYPSDEESFVTDAPLSVELTAFTAEPSARGVLLR
jgi:hypothetical protein